MTNPVQDRPPAIVLGRDATGLGALRCLHLAGIPAYVACPPSDLPTRSRWYRPIPGEIAWDGTIGPQALEILRSIPLSEAVLIPGADDAALWLADLPQGELTARFKISSSPRHTLEILQDKTRFATFLERTNIPHPRTFPLASAEDAAAVPFSEMDRVFVKPSNSQKFNQVIGAKGVWASSHQQLEQIRQRLDGRGFKLMAQEYVPGTSADHYFVDGFRDRDGNLTGLFARRRIRIFPPDFGNSSYCRSIPLTEIQGAVDSIIELLSRLNYRGIFSAEFKRDARNGQFRVLEVNTRAWWYVEFAARCGVNVCRMAWEDALGLPVTAAPRSYPVGVGCVNLYGDIKTVLARKPPARDRFPKVLMQWAGAHFHVFRLDDPAPAWSILRHMIAGNIRRRVFRK
ncbi:MAG: hypothetical protein WCE70_09420 [Rhodanobacteraceae bacterium]